MEMNFTGSPRQLATIEIPPSMNTIRKSPSALLLGACGVCRGFSAKGRGLDMAGGLRGCLYAISQCISRFFCLGWMNYGASAKRFCEFPLGANRGSLGNKFFTGLEKA